VIQDFRHEWSTANQIRWAWDIEDDTRLSYYELDIAASVEALLAGDFDTIDSGVSPELAHSLLRASGEEPVESTVVRDLEAHTVYAARLVTFDTSMGVTCSPAVVQAQTGFEANRPIELFEDDPAPGHTQPGWLEWTMGDDSHDGSDAHYALAIACRPHPELEGEGETCPLPLCPPNDIPTVGRT